MHVAPADVDPVGFGGSGVGSRVVGVGFVDGAGRVVDASEEQRGVVEVDEGVGAPAAVGGECPVGEGVVGVLGGVLHGLGGEDVLAHGVQRGAGGGEEGAFGLDLGVGDLGGRMAGQLVGHGDGLVGSRSTADMEGASFRGGGGGRRGSRPGGRPVRCDPQRIAMLGAQKRCRQSKRTTLRRCDHGRKQRMRVLLTLRQRPRASRGRSPGLRPDTGIGWLAASARIMYMKFEFDAGHWSHRGRRHCRGALSWWSPSSPRGNKSTRPSRRHRLGHSPPPYQGTGYGGESSGGGSFGESGGGGDGGGAGPRGRVLGGRARNSSANAVEETATPISAVHRGLPVHRGGIQCHDHG